MIKLSIWGRGESSKAIARALGVPRNRLAKTIIRWKRLDNPRIPAIMEFNKADAIRLASHKYQSLVAIKEAGLNVPKLTKLFQVVEEDIDLNPANIWFGRDNYHTRGSDIIVIKSDGVYHNDLTRMSLDNEDSNQGKDYYIQYFKPRGEYRYHVAFRKVILCTKKILTEGEDSSLIRNHQDGKWKQVVCVETPRFSEACIKAVECLGLDFGAVDFLNYKKEAYILEVNTAPGLEVENRLEAYTKAFKENIGCSL